MSAVGNEEFYFEILEANQDNKLKLDKRNDHLMCLHFREVK